MTGRHWGAIGTTTGWQMGIWAPRAKTVQVLLAGQPHDLEALGEGWWGKTLTAPTGAPYLFRVDGADLPDPASRLQSGDVHAPSLLTAPPTPADQGWSGREWSEAVVYEMHVGTFTPEGSFAAAAARMPYLAELGFTAIELMPLGQWQGARGWGYDGVLPFAPHPAYGSPADLRAFVDAAHRAGLMVILDLVMNHFGPEGAYIHTAAPGFFDADRQTPWGAAIDFTQDPVRRFWTGCALHWLRDYGMDGLRLDAVHQIAGPAGNSFLHDMARDIHGLDLGRPLHLITEDDRNIPDLREKAGYDASWNDDFHHAVHVALTGESGGYYATYAQDPLADLARALERGHIEEGQSRPPCDTVRGQPCAHLPPTAFVNAIQTHDQIGNRARGDRLLTLADPQGVATSYALLLCAPFIPMVFMGEERGETAPFRFFVDFTGDLADAVRRGRTAEFPGIAIHGDGVPDPVSVETFRRSRLDWTETPHAREWQDLTRRALAFRAAHVVPLLKSGRRGTDVTRDGDIIHACWRFGAGDLTIALSFGTPAPYCHDTDTETDTVQFTQGRFGTDPFAIIAKVQIP